MRYQLQVGFKSSNGQVEIVDEDRLCFIVRNNSKGASALRTISKVLLEEYVEYYSLYSDCPAQIAREELSGNSDIDKFEYGYTSTLSIMAKMVLGIELPEEFKKQSPIQSTLSPVRPALDEPLQLIFYGAPGTGKSFRIDGMTSDANTVRTTFHPDSDYSSFVGAYKPTMQPMPIHAVVGTTVHKAKTADNDEATEKKIVYKYVPQAFMKAYVEAWKDLDNPHFLVIEEINRGNCAQIFGDLFQLLDRNAQGCSSYAIHADEDISQFLSSDDNGFANLPEETANAIRRFVLHKDNGKTEEIGASILTGKKLLLPPNLYIWATMNTSDQSLFPIDSAFKRRWNWEYIPIRFFENDTDPSLANRSFQIGSIRYSWADFLKIINPIISELTESADKQMGFFFAKPDKKSDPSLNDNDIISEKIFLNKVLFYLWTDVLKDFNVGREEFKKPDGKNLEFTDFFEESQNYLAQFVAKLGIAEIAANDDARP